MEHTMHTATAFQLRGWRVLLSGLAFLLIALGITPQKAHGQSVCDLVDSEVRALEDSCCFRVLLENSAGNANVLLNKVEIWSEAEITSYSGGNVATTTRNNSSSVAWTFANGVPARTDAIAFCIDGKGKTGPFWTTITWYDSQNRQVCSDTVELECENNREDCIQIIEQEIECRKMTGGPQNSWAWNFNIRNKSTFYATQYQLESQTQGVSISPTSGSVNGTVAPNAAFPRSNIVITGGQPGQTVRIVVSICGSTTPETDDWICCEEIIEITLPDCREGCFEIVEQNIECTDRNTFEWCFTFRNQSNETYNRVYVNNTWYSIAPTAPGQTRRVCIPITGTPGQAATFVVNLCRYDSIVVKDSASGNSSFEIRRIGCCEQRVELKLPECGEDGCLELVNQEIACDSAGYIWCFNIRNQANWSTGSFTVVPLVNEMPLSGFPRVFNLNTPVPAGGLSERFCVRLEDVRPGPLMVSVINCADRIQVCCVDTIEITLPECDPHGKDCCDGFEIGVANIAPVAAPNGLTGLLGAISAGPNNIKKTSATIVSATVNGQPAYGYFNSGLILNPLGAGTVTPPPFGQELIWNAPAGGINMNAPSLTLEWLRFPPMAPNARVDTLSFCIRWRFTDTECRTCDTLVCYSVVRNQFLLRDLQNTSEKGTSTLGGNNGFVNGELTGQNSATLSIELPTLPSNDFGDVTYTGITLQADEGVQISAVNGSGATFSTQHGLAIAQISATGGTKFDLDISYDNLNNKPALGHFLLLGYESSLAPGIQQQLPLTVTLRQAGTDIGGDQVEAVKTEIQGAKVETFALHLKNANNTSESLNGLRITTGGGVKLLAVGPTSSDEEALLRFGAAGETGRTYISEASEGTMQLAPGAERNPIYLTVSYDGELPPIVNYATLNGLDEVVSEGTVDLTQVSSVHDGNGVTGTSISLGESHPNPTTGQATISLRLSEREQVNLVLRDSRGSEVARLLDGEVLESGVHVVNADVSSLSNGVYFYTLETPTGTETRKLVIQK